MDEDVIGVITFPIDKSGIHPLSNLLNILFQCSKNIYLITGNKGYENFQTDSRYHTIGITHKQGNNYFSRILKFFWTQIQISCHMIKISKNVNFWIFFFGESSLFLPLLIAKLQKKNCYSSCWLNKKKL